jgi:hypothetical protein
MTTRIIAMIAMLKAAVVATLGLVASPASAQTEQGPLPQTNAPPGIIVMPPRLPPAIAVPGQQSPVGNQQPHTCPATDQKLELIG